MLFPKEDYRSTYDIPFEEYYRSGYRGVVFDIDNTLVCHNAPADERAVLLFERLRKTGFSHCLISNNRPPRVEGFADAVKSMFVADAGKPLAKGYVRACEMMGLPKEKCFFVGDQIFTDIWGANNAGIHSVLVRPLGPECEFQIVLKRFLEYPVILLYRIMNRKKS